MPNSSRWTARNCAPFIPAKSRPTMKGKSIDARGMPESPRLKHLGKWKRVSDDAESTINKVCNVIRVRAGRAPAGWYWFMPLSSTSTRARRVHAGLQRYQLRCHARAGPELRQHLYGLFV